MLHLLSIIKWPISCATQFHDATEEFKKALVDKKYVDAANQRKKVIQSLLTLVVCYLIKVLPVCLRSDNTSLFAFSLHLHLRYLEFWESVLLALEINK